MDLGLRSELTHLGIYCLWRIIRSAKSRKMRGSSQIHAQSLYSQGKKRTWNLQGRQRWKEKLEQMEGHTGQGKMGAWTGMVPTSDQKRSRREWGLRREEWNWSLVGGGGSSQAVLRVKNLPAIARDIRNLSSIAGWGRSPGRGYGNPLQSSFLENPMDRGSWWAKSIRSQRIGHEWSDWALTHAGGRYF